MPAYKEDNNTWTSRFYITDYKGVKIQKKERGFTTKREALEFEREAIAKAEFTSISPPLNVTPPPEFL